MKKTITIFGIKITIRIKVDASKHYGIKLQLRRIYRTDGKVSAIKYYMYLYPKLTLLQSKTAVESMIR